MLHIGVNFLRPIYLGSLSYQTAWESQGYPKSEDLGSHLPGNPRDIRNPEDLGSLIIPQERPRISGTLGTWVLPYQPGYPRDDLGYPGLRGLGIILVGLEILRMSREIWDSDNFGCFCQPWNLPGNPGLGTWGGITIIVMLACKSRDILGLQGTFSLSTLTLAIIQCSGTWFFFFGKPYLS